MNKKILGIAVFLVVTVSALFLVAPGLNIPSVFGQSNLCDDDPTNPNCFCYDGFDKLVYETYDTFYYCEVQNPTINTESPTFDADFKAFAEQALSNTYPNCDMTACNQGDAKWRVGHGVSVGPPGKENIHRVAYADCYDDTQKVIFAEVLLKVADGKATHNYSLRCTNYFQKQSQPGTSYVNGIIRYDPTALNRGSSTWSMNRNIYCNAIGDKILGEVTYSPPKGLTVGCGTLPNCAIDSSGVLRQQLDLGICGAIWNYGEGAGMHGSVPVITSNSLWCLGWDKNMDRVLYQQGDYRCEVDRSVLAILGVGYPDELQSCEMGNGGFMTFQKVVLGEEIDNCKILTDGTPVYDTINLDGSCTSPPVSWKQVTRVQNGDNYCQQYGEWTCGGEPRIGHDPCPTGKPLEYKYYTTLFQCSDSVMNVVETRLDGIPRQITQCP